VHHVFFKKNEKVLESETGPNIVSMNEPAVLIESSVQPWKRHSETMKAPLLHQNLTLKRRGQDPMLSYSLVAILGEGSMGSVGKVLKRDNVGSARSELPAKA
jgi:hypothetical protein